MGNSLFVGVMLLKSSLHGTIMMCKVKRKMGLGELRQHDKKIRVCIYWNHITVHG